MAKKGAPRQANSKKPTTKLSKVKRSKPYPIVAIGASAGGLEAINEPTHESLLTRIEPNQGLLLLPNKDMILNQGLMWPIYSF
jgi:chemotaxis response regulator CheB